MFYKNCQGIGESPVRNVRFAPRLTLAMKLIPDRGFADTLSVFVKHYIPCNIVTPNWHDALTFRMEKMISGMYMGEIVRLTLERLTMEGLLFNGVDTECELFIRGRFYTKYVSEIER